MTFSERIEIETSKGLHVPKIYPGGPDQVRKAAEEIKKFREKNILVIGTEVPWIEAVLHEMKPKKIVTLEYNDIERYITELKGMSSKLKLRS